MSLVQHKPRDKFLVLPNATAIDLTLSDGAFRVLSYLASKFGSWVVNNHDIMNNLGISRNQTIAKYWKELLASGWITRQPSRNASGKPTGFFDYVINEKPILPKENCEAHQPDGVPTAQKAQEVSKHKAHAHKPLAHKPHTVKQQVRINRNLTNTKTVTNNNINTHTKNIKQTVLNGAEWVRIAEENKIEFSEIEKTAIQDFGDEFLRIRSKIEKSVTEKFILQELNKLRQYKVENYNIVLLIQDSISYEGGFLFKTTPKYLMQSTHKSNSESKPAQRPHLYDNPKYIIPETPAEKKSLAAWIQNCYKARINPKTNQPMTTEEIAIINAHNKRFNSQQKNNLGFYVSYASWLDYILQNEVNSRTSLLDQPLDEPSANKANQPTNLHIGDTL